MHPSIETRRDIIIGAAVVLTFAALLTLLFSCYGKPEKIIYAAAASVAYTIIFTLSIYQFWYVKQYLKAFGAKIVLSLLVQLASISASVAILAAIDPTGPDWFYRVLPLLISIGFLCWISITLWYTLKGCQEDQESEINEVNRADSNVLENISIKEGNRTHIIRAEQLHYINAYGDYVMLHTAEGKFIKEQTMKHFEATLPEYFVRIHRSVIVNTRIIVRTELYGKESYTIHLNSGVTLRASSAGYKLLKSKLFLN